MLPVKKLSAVAGEIEELGVDRLARRLQLDFRTADLLLYSLELHIGLAQELRLDEIVVPAEDFEESLLTGLVSPAGAVDNFRRQVAQTALNLGKKFKIDTAHAQQVARLCATLFQELEELHDLGRREALILTAAALLHETGHLIGSRDHHLHSLYIIRHNEVFGLDQMDTLLIGLGFLLLVGFGFMGLRDLLQMSGLKNALTVIINGVACVWFAVFGAVRWVEAGVMAAGAIAGGLTGARLARRVGGERVRPIVVAIGITMSIFLLVRAL